MFPGAFSAILLSSAAVAGAYYLLNTENNDLISQRNVVEAEINAPEIQERLTVLNEKFTEGDYVSGRVQRVA